MAGLEGLTSLIYHERQPEGSMLCAQHALNALLQGNYFTAPDLAHIAQEVDRRERESLNVESYEDASANMDDTGFFSVQVIEQALEVWGLSLVRWRSEQMRPYQDRPHTQLAFILNLKQHWFTLRRFGPAEPDMSKDPGLGHWYNLNSALAIPEWISRTYLGMVIQQSEDEGYSVFAVIQSNKSAPLALPRVDADYIAATLDRSDPGTSVSLPSQSSAPSSDAKYHSAGGFAFEEEDFDLQAALQASLGGAGGSEDPISSSSIPPQTIRPPIPAPAPALTIPPVPPVPDLVPSLPGTDSSHMTMFERMRAQQEAAFREVYETEVERFRPGGPTTAREPSQEIPPPVSVSSSTLPTATARVASPDEDEDITEPESEEELLRRAIAESRRSDSGTFDVAQRVYDDEDADFQAALRASLEGLPEGFAFSAPPGHDEPIRPSDAPPAASRPIQPLLEPQMDVDEDEYDDEEEMPGPTVQQVAPTLAPPPEPVVDVDEMRRRRLARFGATGSGSISPNESG